MSATAWRLWFDGTACPNPGRLGLGAVIEAPDARRWEVSAPAGCFGCNNEAELLALAKALELAQAQGALELLVHGDSDFAIRHLSGAAQTAVPRLQLLLAQVAVQLEAFQHVTLQWVPRHRNPDADRLCRAALGLPDKSLKVVKRKRRRGKGAR